MFIQLLNKQMAGVCSKTPRLLVISTNRWPLAGQLASALVVAGFEVAVVCPTASPVNRIRKIYARFSYRSWMSSTSIRLAIAAWSPGILVCTDDVAVRELHCLYLKASKKKDDRNSQELMKLIESSLGNHRYFAKTLLKSQILVLAQSLGIACPRTRILNDNLTLKQEIDRIVFPILVKADKSSGGRGVRLVTNRPRTSRCDNGTVFAVQLAGSL